MLLRRCSPRALCDLRASEVELALHSGDHGRQRLAQCGEEDAWIRRFGDEIHRSFAQRVLWVHSGLPFGSSSLSILYESERGQEEKQHAHSVGVEGRRVEAVHPGGVGEDQAHDHSQQTEADENRGYHEEHPGQGTHLLPVAALATLLRHSITIHGSTIGGSAQRLPRARVR